MLIVYLALAALVANLLCYGILTLLLGRGFRIWRLQSSFAGATLVLALCSLAIWLTAQAVFRIGGCRGSQRGGTDCASIDWTIGAFLFDLTGIIEFLAMAGGPLLIGLALMTEWTARTRD